jgi:hypothetical protein
MKKNLYTTLCLCLIQAMAMAQTRVTGRIADAEDKSPMPYATVAVYSISDTTLIDGAITADSGTFALSKVSRGQYILKVSFTGYTPLFKMIEVVNLQRPLDLGPIELHKGVELDEVEIAADLIPILFKGDTIEYSAAAFQPTQGAMLEELLKRLPGVEVERDGTVKSNGRVIRQILVDGERFFTDNPGFAVQNIPADYVQKVQVFDKKSEQAEFTGVNDGNEETVINLVFKPEVKKGWFGRFTAGGGADLQDDVLFRYNNRFTLNHFRGKDQLSIFGTFNNIGDFQAANAFETGSSARMETGMWRMVGSGLMQSIVPSVNWNKTITPKLRLNADYSVSRTDHKIRQRVRRESILSNGSQFFDQEDTTNTVSIGHRFGGHLTYEPNKNNRLHIRPSVSINNNSSTSSSMFETHDDTLALINQGIRRRTSENSTVSASLSTMYMYNFTKPRRSISIGADGSYNTTHATSFNYSQNDFISRIDTIDQKITNHNNRYNWRVRMDYTEPLPLDFILGLTYNISSGESKSENLYDDYNSVDSTYNQRDTVHSSVLGNRWFSQGFDIRLRRTKEKLHFSLSLRLLPSNTLNTIQGKEDIKQTNLNFTPTTYFSYQFSRQSSVDFRYTGRTQQPSTQDLAPIPNNFDPLNIRVGNPNLKSAFYHSFQSTFRRSYENFSSISGAFTANINQNEITYISIFNPDLFPNITLDSAAYRPGARLTMADNMNTYFGSGAIGYNTPIVTQRFQLSTSSSLSLRNSKSIVDRDVNTLNSTTFRQSLSLTYRQKEFDVALNGIVRGNTIKYSLQQDRNHIQYTTSYGTNFSWTIIEGVLTLSNSFSFEKTTGYSDGFDPEQMLWNAHLVWNIGKAKKGRLRFEIIDILNDQKDTQRIATENVIQDQTTNMLRRYFMVSFSYNINSHKESEYREELRR